MARLFPLCAGALGAEENPKIIAKAGKGFAMALGERPDTETMLEALFTSDFSRDESAWNEAVEADRPDHIVVPEPDEEGHFESPALLALHAAWDAYGEEKAEPDQVLELLERVHKAIGTQLAFLDEMVADGEEDPDNPIHQSIYAGFTKQSAAVERMKTFFEDGDEDCVDVGIAEFQEGTDQMMAGYVEFQKLRIEAMKIACPKCGADNRRGDAKCEKCGTALPQPEKVESKTVAVAAEGVHPTVEEELSTPNFEKVDAAVAAWRDQKIDDKDLKAVFDEVEANLRGHADDVDRERQKLGELGSQEQEIMIGLLNATGEALEQSLGAMERFNLYFETGDAIHIDRAMAQLWEGTKLIIRAYHAHEQVVAKAEKDTGETFD